MKFEKKDQDAWLPGTQASADPIPKIHDLVTSQVWTHFKAVYTEQMSKAITVEHSMQSVTLQFHQAARFSTASCC